MIIDPALKLSIEYPTWKELKGPRSSSDEIYIYIRVGMMEIDQSSFTSVLSVHR